ncbi:MAG: nucleotidyltransferase family protein [Hydrogenophaga sp.]
MAGILKDGGGLHRRLVVGAVLLAAGSGSRMGHRPKCLLELDGVSLIRRQLMALSEAGVDEVVVVLGHYGERIAQAVHEDFQVTLVHNLAPEAGQVSSLRLGLQALSSQIDAVVVALADQPLICAQDIRALVNAFERRPDGCRLVQPQVAGLPGNPVVFSQSVREHILAEKPDFGAKQWQAAHPERVWRWPSANQRYRMDVDSPEDLETLALATGYRLRWPSDLEKNTPGAV